MKHKLTTKVQLAKKNLIKAKGRRKMTDLLVTITVVAVLKRNRKSQNLPFQALNLRGKGKKGRRLQYLAGVFLQLKKHLFSWMKLLLQKMHLLPQYMLLTIWVGNGLDREL